MSLIPEPGRQGQVDLSMFEASLVSKVSPEQPGLHREKPFLKNQTNQTNKDPTQILISIKLFIIRESTLHIFIFSNIIYTSFKSAYSVSVRENYLEQPSLNCQLSLEF